MSDLEELTEEEKKEIKEFYPPFISRKMIELTDEINNRKPTHIDDFYRLHLAIWKIYNKAYQEEYWGNKQGQWGDNYGETTLTFYQDVQSVLDTSDYAVEMTPKQREMLQNLLDMVLEYDGDKNNPLSRYGENDQAIIEDPRWQEIGKYAKLVYEELSGDDLDAWEKTRPQQARPLDLPRKPIDQKEYESFIKSTYPSYILECEQKAIGNNSLFCFVPGLLFDVWEMSDKEFQEKFWVNKEHPFYDDKNCKNTRADFCLCANYLIGQSKYMTTIQSNHLQKLYDMIEDFNNDPTAPDDPGFGLNDSEVIKHAKWDKIREYAKVVYQSLSETHWRIANGE